MRACLNMLSLFLQVRIVCQLFKCLYKLFVMFVFTLIATGKIGLADIGNVRVRTTLLGRQISSLLVDQPTAEL